MTVAIYITERTPEGYLSGYFIGPVEQFDRRTSASKEPILIHPGAFLTSGDRRRFPPGVRPWDRAFTEFGPGDLIVADDAIGWPMRTEGEKGWELGLKLANNVQVFEKGLTSTTEAISAYSLYLERKSDMEAANEQIGFPVFRERSKTLCDISIEADAVAARYEKDELLALSFIDEDGSLATETILHTGSMFFHMAHSTSNAFSDLGIDEPDKPGLFILKDGGAYAHRGESGYCDDWGVDGELEEITVEEAAAHFGETIEQMKIEIEAQYPYEFEGDILDAVKVPASCAAIATGATPSA